MKYKLLRKFLGKVIGRIDHFVEGDWSYLSERYPEYEIGAGTYGWPQILHAREGASLKIGAYCSISKGVQIILGGEHHTEWLSTYPFPFFFPSASHIKGHPKTKGNVIIGNDVWIGRDATILSGVTIGNGAVIGAHAVVSKNVEPYSIVAGNPAKFIKKRFSDETIELLEMIAWWTWPKEEIEQIIPVLLSSNIAELQRYWQAKVQKEAPISVKADSEMDTKLPEIIKQPATE